MSTLNPPGAKPATATTAACQHAARRWLPLADKQSFEDAQRGFIAPIPKGTLSRANGAPVWSLEAYGFLAEEEAPDSVHPGLWRQARLNMITGLFRVTERIYQVRGYDISNMTIMEGDSGLVIVDPLISTEVARAALALYFEHRPQSRGRAVKAVIYSHSHVDHFGGVRGVIDEADVKAGRVQVVAPAGFMEEAASENVLAGNAMTRRAHYQFGPLLPKGPLGQVDAGLGKTVSMGTVTLIAPTLVIRERSERHVLDGIECIFELTPGAEAPSEMIIHHPAWRVLNMTEIASHNFHNLLPLRGAQVRDAKAWASYLDGALLRYGEASDVLIAQHHWPVWGAQALQGFLHRQRDLYKYVHDQTLRLMNHGWLAGEIAEVLQLPKTLQQDWSAHGFYGTVKHNVRAVVQRYLGAYDAHPAHLDPLPPALAARKSLEYMGGAAAVLARAREDFARGEYRWVAEVCALIVHAGRAGTAGSAAQAAQAAGASATADEARQGAELCADALEQLGYQAESATWRNAYLQGAMELRHGPPQLPGTAAASADMVRALTLDMWFDFLAVRLDGAKADGKRFVINWHFTDSGERVRLNLDNGALTHRPGVHDPAADASLTLTRALLDEISMQQTTFPEAVQTGRAQVQGKAGVLLELFSMVERFPRMFSIVGPRPFPEASPNA